MLKLFYAPGTCARASHIALREADADFELQLVDFSTAEQRAPEYLGINPKGRVPALQTDAGILTETPAILTYIAQIFPTANLAPLSDPFEFARLQGFNNYLCATVHVAHAHRRRGERWADDPAAIAAMQRKTPESVAACFQLIEDHYLTTPWAMGSTYTVGDPYLFTITQWLPFHNIELAAFPKVADHHSRMLERPAVQAALDAEPARKG